MTKSDTISEIMRLNRSAAPGFLSDFSDEELVEYLDRLAVAGAIGSSVPTAVLRLTSDSRHRDN